MSPQPPELIRLFLASLCCSAALAAGATPAANPYHLIVQQNSFRLGPPDESPVETPRPATQVGLQGLTTALGRPLALMKLTLPGNVPELSVILGEGERVAGVEVIRINGPSRTVSVLNDGKRQLLFLHPDTPAR